MCELTIFESKYMKINKKIFLTILVIMLTTLQAQAASDRITVAKAFYELAHQNNIGKMESLLNRGYSLESIDENGYNPVCLSVIKQAVVLQ